MPLPFGFALFVVVLAFAGLIWAVVHDGGRGRVVGPWELRAARRRKNSEKSS